MEFNFKLLVNHTVRSDTQSVEIKVTEFKLS